MMSSFFQVNNVFSQNTPSVPILSIGLNVCPCVRLYVRVSVCALLRYCLNVFLPPLTKDGYLFFIQRFGILGEILLITDVKLTHKKGCFWENFALVSRIFWYCCYYPYQSRDSLSAVCGIFIFFWLPNICIILKPFLGEKKVFFFLILFFY